MAAVDPDGSGGGAGEVEGDVEEAEEGRRAGDRGERCLHVALDEHAEALLEGDDVAGVVARCSPVLAAEAAHDLVHRVQGGEAGELDAARVGACGAV